MKTIIAGSRSITDFAVVDQTIKNSGYEITEVISGTAKGVDTLGEEWASLNNIPITRFPADWKTYGKSAGYIRNEEMAKYADALIAIWDGKSKGTRHMVNLANKYKLRLYISGNII
jgi:hypothetical protein